MVPTCPYFFVALGLVDPGVEAVGQHFALEVCLHISAHRHVFGVVQLDVGLLLALLLAPWFRARHCPACAWEALDGNSAIAELVVGEDLGEGHDFDTVPAGA